jgi:predicted anti-sigma-YlaC factor YlaD
MSCKEYQNQIVLSLYEELQEGERVTLEIHLEECGDCREVFEENQGFHAVLAQDTPAWELPSELLIASRRALADELDRIEKKRSWWSIPTFSVVLTPMRMLESAALVAMGLALGIDAAGNPAGSGYRFVDSDERKSFECSYRECERQRRHRIRR